MHKTQQINQIKHNLIYTQDINKQSLTSRTKEDNIFLTICLIFFNTFVKNTIRK